MDDKDCNCPGCILGRAIEELVDRYDFEPEDVKEAFAIVMNDMTDKVEAERSLH